MSKTPVAGGRIAGAAFVTSGGIALADFGTALVVPGQYVVYGSIGMTQVQSVSWLLLAYPPSYTDGFAAFAAFSSGTSDPGLYCISTGCAGLQEVSGSVVPPTTNSRVALIVLFGVAPTHVIRMVAQGYSSAATSIVVPDGLQVRTSGTDTVAVSGSLTSAPVVVTGLVGVDNTPGTTFDVRAVGSADPLSPPVRCSVFGDAAGVLSPVSSTVTLAGQAAPLVVAGTAAGGSLAVSGAPDGPPVFVEATVSAVEPLPVEVVSIAAQTAPFWVSNYNPGHAAMAESPASGHVARAVAALEYAGHQGDDAVRAARHNAAMHSQNGNLAALALPSSPTAGTVAAGMAKLSIGTLGSQPNPLTQNLWSNTSGGTFLARVDMFQTSWNYYGLSYLSTGAFSGTLRILRSNGLVQAVHVMGDEFTGAGIGVVPTPWAGSEGASFTVALAPGDTLQYVMTHNIVANNGSLWLLWVTFGWAVNGLGWQISPYALPVSAPSPLSITPAAGSVIGLASGAQVALTAGSQVSLAAGSVVGLVSGTEVGVRPGAGSVFDVRVDTANPVWTSAFRPAQTVPAALAHSGDAAAVAADRNRLAHALNGNYLVSEGHIPAFIRSCVAAAARAPRFVASASLDVVLRDALRDYAWEGDDEHLASNSGEPVLRADVQVASAAVSAAVAPSSTVAGFSCSDDEVAAICGDPKSRSPSTSPSASAAGGASAAAAKPKVSKLAAVSSRVAAVFCPAGRPDFDGLAAWVMARKPKLAVIKAIVRSMASAADLSPYAYALDAALPDPQAWFASAGDMQALLWATCYVSSPQLADAMLGLGLASIGVGGHVGLLCGDLSARAAGASYRHLVAELSNWLGPASQRVPAPPAAGGAGAAAAAAHNREMHATNGNIVAGSSSGADAVRAARHNRVMHSLNGNMAGAAAGGSGAAVTSASLPGVATGASWVTNANAPTISEWVSKHGRPSDEYIPIHDLAQFARTAYGALLGVRRNATSSAAGLSRIVQASAPPVVTTSGLVGVPVSPLLFRSTIVGGALTPCTWNMQLQAPTPMMGLGYALGTSEYSTNLVARSNMTALTARVSSVSTETNFNFNDEVLITKDSAGTERFNPEQIAAAAHVMMAPRALLAPEVYPPDSLTSAHSPSIIDDYTLANRIVHDRRGLYPPAEVYGVFPGVGGAYTPVAVCGLEAHVSLHTSMTTAFASRDAADAPGGAMPIQVNARLANCLGPTRIGKVLAIIGGLLAPQPITPVSLVSGAAPAPTMTYTHGLETLRLPGLQDIRFYLPQNARSTGRIPGTVAEANLEALFRPSFGPVPTTNGQEAFYAPGAPGATAANLVMDYVASGDAASRAYSLTALWTSWEQSADPITAADIRVVLAHIDQYLPLLSCLKFVAQLLDTRATYFKPLATNPAPVYPTHAVAPELVYYDGSYATTATPDVPVQTFTLYESIIKAFSRALGGHLKVADPLERWAKPASSDGAGVAMSRPAGIWTGPINYVSPFYSCYGPLSCQVLASAHQMFTYAVGRSGSEIQAAQAVYLTVDTPLADIAQSLDSRRMGVDAGVHARTQDALACAYAAVSGGKKVPRDLAGHSLFGRRSLIWADPAVGHMFSCDQFCPAVMTSADMFFLMSWLSGGRDGLLRETAPFPTADILAKSISLPMGEDVAVLVCAGRGAAAAAPLFRRSLLPSMTTFVSPDEAPWEDGTLMYNIRLNDERRALTGLPRFGVYGAVTGTLRAAGLRLFGPVMRTSFGETVSLDLSAWWPRRHGNEMLVPMAPAGPNTDQLLISEYAQQVNQPVPTYILTPIATRPSAVYALGPRNPSVFERWGVAALSGGGGAGAAAGASGTPEGSAVTASGVPMGASEAGGLPSAVFALPEAVAPDGDTGRGTMQVVSSSTGTTLIPTGAGGDQVVTGQFSDGSPAGHALSGGGGK